MNYFIVVIVKGVIVALFIPGVLQAILNQGRNPDKMDQTLCKVQMYDRLDKIQESEDPRAEVEAYFNRTGKPCKTFCRIRSADKRFDKISDIFDAPIYTTCGNERYCTEGGKCKKIGSVIKVDKQSKKVEDTLKKSNSTRKGKGDGGENGDGDGGYGDLDNRTLQTTGF